ncbi:hypothetical protein N658DRAFT_541196 [Parathielavia hyrcaniae]|uniref:Zn(2)-C6 fungal-type domain-containing protein n=1 Tax=Parathielavia hyrcaniae TaxID=113614 RepID=A0AAN6T540_9PEZI|nr:hypothetical protein N658DRAFT_541196 [Parathielavia hyrcaniae]
MEGEQTPSRPEVDFGEGSSSGSTATNQLSCAQCRNRKLRCDRKLPRCDRCVQQGETCNYPGSRQRALGRRRTVRELETRIEELEALLRASNLNSLQQNEETGPDLLSRPQQLFQLEDDRHQNLDLLGVDPLPLYQDLSLENAMFPVQAAPGFLPQYQVTNQLFGLGLFEQLPSWDVIDELTTLYFQNIHAGAPMLHQTSYAAALRLPPHMRPPMCLQYIVMASAAVTSPTCRHLAEPFYQRARVYAEADELKGQGETFTTLGHVQAWCLISAYECHVHAIFNRASTSLCRAAEERRRTWWVTFMADRFLSSITGWPSLVKERHVRNNLPSTEEAFTWGINTEAPVTLPEALRVLQQQSGAQPFPFAIRILAANELLHALDHTAHHTPANNNNSNNFNLEDMLNERYWLRHKELDSNLTTLTFFLPASLQLSNNPRSLDAILVHACTHMATIQLHRVALGLLHQYDQTVTASAHLITESQARRDSAAQGVLAVFRTAGGEGLGRAIRNPLLSFAAYMAASVFLEHCLSMSRGEGRGGGSGRHESEDSLKFLAQTLVFYARGSPLVRANAFQLATDMKRAGYDSSMMDSVTGQIQTLGGSVSEIQVPGSSKRPMLFCPALTSTLDSDESAAFGLQGAFGL